jgi:predicted nucleic acid-binding protein
VGLTVLDSGVVIGFLDGGDRFHRSATRALGEAFHEGALVLPMIAFAEIQVGLLLAGAEASFLATMCAGLAIDVAPLDVSVASRAARLRVGAMGDRRRRQWRMPDALVVATALDAGASAILTTDRRWPAVDGPDVVVLDED